MAHFVLRDARRMLHRLSTLVAAFAISFLSLVVTSRASAQSITVANEASLARVDASGEQIRKRPLSLNPEAINAQDCREDQKIRLPIELTGFQPTAKLEIWASLGADCSSAPNREPVTGSCWSLFPDVPLQMQTNLDLPVRALLSPTSDESQCGKVDLTVIDVQILYFAPGNYEAPVISKHVTFTADTVGPEPPRAAINAGNGRARIALVPTAEFSGIVSTTAYCEKSASPDACTSTALVPGAEPPADPSFECGKMIGASTGATLFTDPLENGTNHVVAIAAGDNFGNLGPLSTVTCVTPSADAETRVQGLDEPTGCTMGAIGGSHRRAGGAGSALVAVLGLVLARRRAKEAR